MDQGGTVQDGPDPDGRILFGPEVRMDDVLGHVVGPLFAIDADGSDLALIVSCNVERPRFSPDGSRLTFSIEMDNGTWQVATSNPDGSDLRILTSVAGLAETPDWGPDGSWLIYALGDEEWQYNLWRMNADGSDQRLIGHPNEIDWEPRLSPDGREVVFTRYSLATALEPRITIRNLETGVDRLATPDDQRPEHPDWSRDGNFVVYTTHWEGEGLQQIKRVPADDSAAEPVVLYGDKGHDGFKAAYSPDGARIVFGCGPAMCLMDADGSNVVELLHPEGAFPNHFDWGPPAP
jgi:Tol biopolymer transport system component